MAWALLPAAPAILPVLGVRFCTARGHFLLVSFPRRRLPHLHPPGHSLFVSWHLHGSLPRGVYPPGKLLSGQAFVSVDRHLDAARRGPLYLRHAAVARLVVESIHRGAELGHYDLHAFVVMPNHVHLLITPRVPPSRLLKSLKGFTAREANRVLGRTGEAFWQRESYDHWVRNQAEFERIAAYIENNPVKAGWRNRPATTPGPARARRHTRASRRVSMRQT